MHSADHLPETYLRQSMNNNLPLLLHLVDGTSSFSPCEKLKTLCTVETLSYDQEMVSSDLLIGVILETKIFIKHHLRSIKNLHATGKKLALIILCEDSDDESLRSAALITQCITFPPISADLNSESISNQILPMLREHIDSIQYIETLELRSHRSEIVDTLNVVAHQWRQPINLISMESINLSIQSTLEECVPSSSVQKSTQMISEQAQRMAEILKNVLNMGKTHRGKEPFSINEMLDKVKLFFADQLQLERIEYKVIKLTEDKSLYGYSSDFEEVLVNLIANAKDALKTSMTDLKTITVEVKDTGSAILFTVKDNAGGIPEIIQAKVFEPHFSTKGQGEGFGIGLHIARLIITQEFKGSINLSTSNNETTFSIIVPHCDTSKLTYIYS